MASEHRIIKVNDLNPKRTRRKKYKRVYKGDVLRISRATDRSANEVAQSFGLNKDYSVSVNKQDLLVLEVHQGTNKILPPQMGGVTIPGLPEGPIQEVLARFPNPLTDEEISCISTFVQQETDAGNWLKYDSFYHLGLLDPVNALTDWVVDGRSATNNGAVLTPGIGAEFFGAEWIDIGFAPADGINLSADEICQNVFLREKIAGAGTMSGVRDSVASIPRFTLRDIGYFYADLTGGSAVVNPYDVVGPNLYYAEKTQQRSIAFINGVEQVNTANGIVGTLDPGNIFIGAFNATPALTASDFMTGEVSSHMAGAPLVDKLANYNNTTQLNECLFIAGVPDRFPNPLEDNERIAILNFLSKENAAGNWDKYDEFWAFGLTDPTNALSGFRGTLATNNGATHTPTQGMEFFGAEYVDTNFVPSVDSEVGTDLNAVQEVYLNEYTPEAIDSVGLAGAEDGIHATRHTGINNGVISYIVNGGSGTGVTIATSESLVSNRGASGGIGQLINGVPKASSGVLPVALSTISQYVGASNVLGVPDLFSTAKIATYFSGGYTGMNFAAHYANLIEFFVLLDKFAGPVIASFPNPLTASEEDAVRAMVNANVLNGNWFKMDSFVAFNMLDGTNALWDWKRLEAATNIGTTHTIGIGRNLDGVGNYINPNYNPFVDGINFKQDDAIALVWVGTNDAPTVDLAHVFGGGEASGGVGGTSLAQQPANNRFLMALNAAASWAGVGTTPAFLNNTLYGLKRTTSILTDLIIDGVVGGSSNLGSGALDNADLFVGAYNDASLVPTYFYKGILVNSMFGAGVGFDQLGYYNSLVEFNASLEADGIIAAFPGVLTATEDTAVHNFLVAEITNGNWGSNTDGVICMSLSDPLNAVWDWKRQISATIAGVVPLSIKGATFDGVATNYINTLYTPTIDGDKYVLANSFMGLFLTEDLNGGTTLSDFAGAGGTAFELITRNSFNTMRWWNNAGSFSSTETFDEGKYLSNTSMITYRKAAAGTDPSSLYLNKTPFASQVAATTVPDSLVYIGARGSVGAGINPMTGSLAFWSIGGTVGFDVLGHDTSMVALMIELGVYSQPVIDSFPAALTPTEETAVRDMVDAEARAGNWQKYDSFVCFSLSGVNALWDWKRKVSVTNNGATLGLTGVSTDGIATWINTEFITNADGINFQLNDGFFGGFIYEETLATGGMVMGANDGGQLNEMRLTVPTNHQAGISAAARVSDPASAIKDKQLLIVSRDNAATCNFITDGVAGLPLNSAVLNMCGKANAIGGSQSSTSTLVIPAQVIVSTYIAGGTIGFNHSDHNTNERKLLTDLGLTL